MGKRPTRTEMRKWVREWWADQMRSGMLPDVPPEFDYDTIDEVWTDESSRIANRLCPTNP